MGTLDHGLWYRSDHEFELYGYLDLDWARSIPDWKITSGYCFSLGSSILSWINKKKSYVALNTTGADYVESYAASREAVCLRKLLSGLFGLGLEVTYIWCDN
jgi:hypothetical protein